MTTRRELLAVIGAGALAAPLLSFAQQQGKVWRIGYLSGRKSRPDPTVDAMLQGLRELGWVEGENLRQYTLVFLEEVKSGSWGVGGTTFTTEAVKQVAAAPRAA